MTYDVFISYKSELVDIVKKIVDVLEHQGNLKCWYAPRNLDRRNSQKDYDDEIVEAISKSRTVVAVLNDSAVTSKWVKLELTQAWDEDKTIIPFAVEHVSVKNGLVRRLINMHWIDAFPNPEERLQLILDNIRSVINEIPIPSEDKKISSMPTKKPQVNDFDFENAKALEEAGELNEAIPYYIHSALNGSLVASNRLCQLFYDNKDLIISNDEWSRIQQEIDEKGSGWASFVLHCHYYNNDAKKSIDYVQRAARAGNVPLAYLRLGICYEWGMGIKLNHTLAMLNFKKAADLGCKEAYSYLGQAYEYGNNKVQQDSQKSFDLYTKGAELGDMRSMDRLARLYLYTYDNFEKGIEVTQQMVELGYYQGYVLQGDAFFLQKKDTVKARDCYKAAMQHDISEAYGSMAWTYIGEDKKEAYRLAQKGKDLGDSASYRALAYFLMDDDQLQESWDISMEGFKQFGSSMYLGELFFEKGFRKKDPDAEKNMENDLKDALEITANNGDDGSLRFLLKLLTLQSLGYESLKPEDIIKVPEAVKYAAIGSEMRMSDVVLCYGQILMNNDYNYYNPAKGVELLQNNALDGNDDALLYLFSRKTEFINDNFGKDIDYEHLALYAMKQKKTNDTIINEILTYGSTANHAEEDFYDYLLYLIDDTTGKDVEMAWRMKAINELIQLKRHQGKGRVVRDDDIVKCENIVGRARQLRNYGYLHILGDNLTVFYSDYNEDKEQRKFLRVGDTNLLYYIVHYAHEGENSISETDETIEQFYSEIADDGCVDEIIKQRNCEVIGISDFWKDKYKEYISSYNSICEKYKISPVLPVLLDWNRIVPYFPSSYAVEINVNLARIKNSLKNITIEESDGYEEMLNKFIEQEFNENITDEEKIDNPELKDFYNLCNQLYQAIDDVLNNNNKLYMTIQNYRKSYNESAIKPLVDIYKQFISRLDINGIHHDLHNADSDSVKKLFNVPNQDESHNTQDGRYDILQNAAGDILIIIKSHDSEPDNPRLVYDGGATALLYRSRDSAVLLEEINLKAREPLRAAEEVLIVEVKNDDVVREYKVPVRIIKALDSL